MAQPHDNLVSTTGAYVHAKYEKKLEKTWVTELAPLSSMFDSNRLGDQSVAYSWPIETDKGTTTKQSTNPAPTFQYAERDLAALATVSNLGTYMSDTWSLAMETVDKVAKTKEALFDIMAAEADAMVHRVRNRREYISWIGGTNLTTALGGTNNIKGLAQAIATAPAVTPDGSTIYGQLNTQTATRTDNTTDYIWHPYVQVEEPSGTTMTKAIFQGNFALIMRKLRGRWALTRGYEPGLVLGKESLPRAVLFVSETSYYNIAEVLSEGDLRLRDNGLTAYEQATGAMRVEGFSIMQSRFTASLGTLWTKTGVAVAIDTANGGLTTLHPKSGIKRLDEKGWNPDQEGPVAFRARTLLDFQQIIKNPSKIGLILGIEA